MRQVFETRFVHAAPHPGNLFVCPMPGRQEKEAGTAAFGSGGPVPYCPSHPFQKAIMLLTVLSVGHARDSRPDAQVYCKRSKAVICSRYRMWEKYV